MFNTYKRDITSLNKLGVLQETLEKVARERKV